MIPFLGPRMATTLKHVCCQAACSSLRSLRHGATRSQSLEATQRQTTRPWSHGIRTDHSETRLRRLYTTTVPRLAQSPRGHGESTGLQETEDEVEPEYMIDETQISSTAHAELEQHREMREMMRTAAWEMPLLTKLARPFEPPDIKQLPLRWRYTTYMGDSHPAGRKVVVEFNIDDLPDLTDKQKLKLQKLVGARLNPETNVVRMNCESYEFPAQNKRYLGDTIQKLLAEVRDPNADSFEDIPLDTRHHKFKKRLEFPEEWKLTPERRAQLEEQRDKLLLEEGKRVEEGQVVSGLAAIEVARRLKLEQAVEEPVPVLATRGTKKSR